VGGGGLVAYEPLRLETFKERVRRLANGERLRPRVARAPAVEALERVLKPSLPGDCGEGLASRRLLLAIEPMGIMFSALRVTLGIPLGRREMVDHDKPRGAASSTELLIAAASGGDSGASGRLLARYDSLLLSFVRRRLGPARFRAEGEDLLQVIRLSITQAMPQVRARDRAAFGAWLKKLVRSKFLDWERRRMRERKRPDGAPLSLDGSWGASFPAATPTPSLILLRKEKKERLARAIESVPERYRPLLRLLSEEDPTLREVAAFLGKPIEPARKFVSRALGHLKRALEGAEGTTRP
jgi:RNA polymerase sigma factor (sigma-70 family)